MASPKLSKIRGKHLMLFVGTAAGTRKAIALCTNSTLSLSAETEDIQTKDDAMAANPEISYISWEATSENYYTVGTETVQATSDMLMSLMINKTPVYVSFGQANNASDSDVPEGGWLDADITAIQPQYYEGIGLITSLEITAQNGEYATCNMTITGKGALTVVTT